MNETIPSETPRGCDERGERGFTLIEVMVVVLIIGILLAVGIPTFLGARERAQDRAAEATLRTAETAAQLLYDDEGSFLLGVSELEAMEPSLTWVTGSSTGPNVVSVSSQTVSDGSAFNVSVASASGRCFQLTLRSNGGRFASESPSSACASGGGAPSVLSFVASDATLTGSMVLDDDGFIGVSEGTTGYNPTPGAAGTATFSFTVSEAGAYRLVATADAPGGSSDSFWVRTSLDDFSTVYLWDVRTGTDYVNDRSNSGQDVLFGIPAGATFVVELSQREDGTRISSLDLVSA